MSNFFKYKNLPTTSNSVNISLKLWLGFFAWYSEVVPSNNFLPLAITTILSAMSLTSPEVGALKDYGFTLLFDYLGP